MRGVLLIAKQRTGTNMLRSALAHSSNVANLGETFHTETLQAPGNFFAWFESSGQTYPLIRSVEWTRDILNQFADFLEGKFGVSVIDVKYNSLYALAPSWQSILAPPPLLTAFRRRKYTIVHLIREKTIEHALSQLIAASTGVYVAYAEDALSGKGPIDVDVTSLVRMARMYLNEIELVKAWLSGYPNALTISYEAFAEGSETVRTHMLKDICSRGDGKFRSYGEPAVKKIVRDWRQYVRNVAEVEEAMTAFHTEERSLIVSEGFAAEG